MPGLDAKRMKTGSCRRELQILTFCTINIIIKNVKSHMCFEQSTQVTQSFSEGGVKNKDEPPEGSGE